MQIGSFSTAALLIASLVGATGIEAFGAPQVQAQGASHKKPSKKKPPLILEERGMFWAGGDYLTRTQPGAENFKVLAGQAYVEYAIPHNKRRNAPPIVLYPGGNLNGTHFLTTPDGREGWADFFLRRGYAVYIVDPPGRGRAGWSVDQFNLVRAGLASPASQPSLAQWDTDAWREWNQGPEFGVHGPHDPSCIGNDGRGAPPFTCHGDRFPTDPASLRHFLAAHAPVGPTAGGETSSLVALLQRIGPAIYIGHSAGGSFGGGVANSRPELFKAMVGIEPAQTCNIATNAVVAGITRVPTMSLHGINQAGRPNVPDCRAKYAEINAAGGNATFIDLIADRGIWGNGHIMMWEDNSDEIAEVILDWIKANVK
ncbi:MAG: hypothetical protein QOH59_3057 [Gemmatimonadales bacterium]|jgi:pimeloyl-ACP methyl ester carboxylesterase|nr:hypothetical protein [Gemmatimonadales bacterium]